MNLSVMTRTIYSALDDFRRYIKAVRSDGNEWATVVPVGSFGESWALAGHMGSFSEHHIDGAGYCTALQILTGAKVWWLQPGEINGMPDMPGHGWNIKEGLWVPLHLMPGDML